MDTKPAGLAGSVVQQGRGGKTKNKRKFRQFRNFRNFRGGRKKNQQKKQNAELNVQVEPVRTLAPVNTTFLMAAHMNSAGGGVAGNVAITPGQPPNVNNANNPAPAAAPAIPAAPAPAPAAAGVAPAPPQGEQAPHNPLAMKTSIGLLNSMKVDSSTPLSSSIHSMVGAKDYWHKFIVLGGAALERTQVLKTVLNAPYCTEFVPVLYRVEGPHATFLARGCTSAISKLFNCKFRLMLEGCSSAEKLVVLEVILCFSHTSIFGLSVHDSLTRCVNKRYDALTRILDLSDFSNDPDLVDLFYCPLWLPRVFSYVLLRAKSLSKPIHHMYLNKNELTTIKVQNIWEEFSSVRSMDLSENNLDTVYCLKALKPLKLTELVLDKNPLCVPYTSGDSYIREVKSFLPTLKKLDGVLLNDNNVPCWLRNYVVAPEGISFVDQFLERYFTIFDSENRQCLKGMYHEEACFSMSANYLGGQSTSSTARLTRYTIESRNLLKISDYSRSFKLISHGPETVVATLCRLPRTEHDPYSFSIDLLLYTANQVVFTVSGVYREPSMMNQALIRFFNRSFVLTKVGNAMFQISNEILFISNATTKQAQDSFKYTQTSPNLTWIAMTAFEQLTDADRQKMTDFMAELTKMNPRWARKCLEESKWKFREALQVFTELLKMDKIPPEAFAKT